jgi:hypothetical protein
MASTREEAVEALRAELNNRVRSGQLVALDLGYIGIADIAGKYADDPTLSDICQEAYRLRDVEPLE